MASSLVVKALMNCGVVSWFERPNKIVNAEGKVGGMAAYISARGLLCHGTLLSNEDLLDVARLTTPIASVAERRYVRSNSTKVANTGVEYETLVREIRVVLEESGARIIETPGPRSEELDLAEALYEEKYRSDEWNLGDPFMEERPPR